MVHNYNVRPTSGLFDQSGIVYSSSSAASANFTATSTAPQGKIYLKTKSSINYFRIKVLTLIKLTLHSLNEELVGYQI